MIDPMLEPKDKLIGAVLPLVPFDGWTAKALSEAALSLGLDANFGERAFPGGPIAAVLHFADLADRQLARDAAVMDLGTMGTTARIAWLVKQRIAPWAPHREAVSRAVLMLSLPHQSGRAARATWQTVDQMWHLAGDQAVDFSYYSKRATLAAVYSSVLLTWLNDSSEDQIESWAFLDRRLQDLARLPRWAKDLQKRSKGFARPAEKLWARLKRQTAVARHFGIK